MNRGWSPYSNISSGEVTDRLPTVLLAIIFDYLTFIPSKLSLFKLKSTEALRVKWK